MKVYHNIYDNLITLENIFLSYSEFKEGKKKTKALIIFERHLEDNLFSLYEELQNRTYTPGSYTGFFITDPKVRQIHKASIKDRIVHHIVSRGLEEIFEPTFIAHSFSCRKNKGTHKGVMSLYAFARKVSKNNTRACWALKCDIRKFFASVNHEILFKILSKKIDDTDYLTILKKIIDSFNSGEINRGLPIGNLTSQFFANIYMNEFDQFVKHHLKIQYYLRYTDDFIFLSEDKAYLDNLLPKVKEYVKDSLDIELHPQKIIMSKYEKGIDFLGYIVFPYHILPRTKTKRRLLKKIKRRIEAYQKGQISHTNLEQTVQSYLGYLKHSSSYKLQKVIKDLIVLEIAEKKFES